MRPRSQLLYDSALQRGLLDEQDALLIEERRETPPQWHLPAAVLAAGIAAGVATYIFRAPSALFVASALAAITPLAVKFVYRAVVWLACRRWSVNVDDKLHALLRELRQREVCVFG